MRRVAPQARSKTQRESRIDRIELRIREIEMQSMQLHPDCIVSQLVYRTTAFRDELLAIARGKE